MSSDKFSSVYRELENLSELQRVLRNEGDKEIALRKASDASSKVCPSCRQSLDYGVEKAGANISQELSKSVAA